MAVVGKAAVEAVKLVSKGFASPGAKAVGDGLKNKGNKELGKGMKALGDNSRDFLAASMAMEQVGKAFHVSGPAMGILSAQFKSATMGTRIELMKSLITLVQTKGFQDGMTIFTGFVNGIIIKATEATTAFDEFTDTVDLLGEALSPVADWIDGIILKVQELLGIDPNGKGGGGYYDDLPLPDPKLAGSDWEAFFAGLAAWNMRWNPFMGPGSGSGWSGL